MSETEFIDMLRIYRTTMHGITLDKTYAALVEHNARIFKEHADALEMIEQLKAESKMRGDRLDRIFEQLEGAAPNGLTIENRISILGIRAMKLEMALAEIDRVYGIKNVVTKEITGITLKDIGLKFERDHQHRWVRRRDGRACVDCGQVEFGDFSVRE